MLDLARARLGAFPNRVTLVQGPVEAAPAGPYDGATCLLVLHFLGREERIATLRAIRTRLSLGAPLVVAHHSIGSDRQTWLARFAAYAVAGGVAPDAAEAMRAVVGGELPILSPEEDEASLRVAGFGEVELFYAAFSFRGWVAVAA